MRAILIFSALVLSTLSFMGCVESSKDLTAAEKEELRPFVSKTAPTPAHALEADLEGKVKLLGYDLSPAEAKPGEPVTITYYWKCERPLGKGWRLFTHVADAAGTNRLNQDREGVVRRLYQPERWKAGEFIKDEQRITLPRDWNSPRAAIFVGIFKEGTRLDITRGPNDGERRIRIASIPTGVSERPASTPNLRAHRVTTAITVDGTLDEPAWNEAPRSSRFVNTMNGEETNPETYVRALYNDTHLYVAFEVKDTFLKSNFENNDDHLWEQDAVEIMIDPNGDGRDYYEIQVAPTGRVFDTRYETRRQPQPFGHMTWNAGIEARVKTDGTVNDDEDDRGYTVEIALPFSGLNYEGMTLEQPRAGQRWRMNFYVMDSPEEGQQEAAGWSAVRVPDFHTPNRFGRVQFFDPAAPATPALEVPPANGTVAPGQPGESTPRLGADALKGLKLRMDQQGRALKRASEADEQQVGEPRPARPPPLLPAPTKNSSGH